ncbi:MAG: hypothetical protein M1380_03260 [Chloroflexi bacterium]|nr:hypothetical protein [Chloroflexota bacterium]
MRSMLMTRAARTLVDLSGVKPGEHLLVLTDTEKFSIGQLVAGVGHEAGARVTFMVQPAGKIHGEELSPVVAAAMKAADVVIAPVLKNIAHTSARLEATKSGTRVLIFPEVTEEMMLGGGIEADFAALRPMVDRLAQKLHAARVARLTNAAGTDVTMSIEGRRGRALNGFANAVDIAAPPGIEASTAPVEGTADGLVVVDGSIPGVGVVRGEPVRIRVKEGRAVSIEGGSVGEGFRDLLASLNDPNVYLLGELGVGMNPKCEIRGNMQDDEGMYGTAHVAFGTNKYIGGTNVAAGHYDVVIRKATLELDGETVVKEGEVLV